MSQPSAAGSGPRLVGVWWYVFLLVMAGTLTYVNSVPNPRVLDDEITLGDNEQILDLTSLAVFMPERELPTAGRPIVNLTFAINYALGGLDVTGYRIVNIAIHVLCGLVLFGLVRRTLLLDGIASTLVDRAAPIAFAAAVLWLVHPLNSEVINYLTQRTESMMGLCYLLTLYASLRAVPEGRGATVWAVIAVLVCAVGMGSKEVMATAPLAVVLFDRAFIFGSFRAALAARWRLYAGLASTWVIIVWLQALSPRPFSAGFSTDVSPWTYLLNQAPLITRYLGLAFWPESLVVSYGWPAPVSIGQVAPYALLLTALLAATVYALWRWPRAGFLGAVFFLTLAPSSSIVPIATEVGAERRMYLALAALIVLVLVAAVRGWDAAVSPAGAPANGVRRLSFVAPVVVVGLSMALAAATVARNREYRSAITLAEITLERYPTPFIHHTLAEALIKADRREEALAHLRQALPGAPRAHYTLGVELYKDGRLTEAIPEFQAFIRAQPRVAHVIEAHGYLGKAYASQQDWSSAIAAFQEILKLTPNNPVAEYSLADVLLAAGRPAEAVPHYRIYLQEQPSDADALNQLGTALWSDATLNEALDAFRRAAQAAPGNGAVQHNLATALWNTGDLDLALTHARQAVALQPDNDGSKELLRTIEGELRGAAPGSRPR